MEVLWRGIRSGRPGLLGTRIVMKWWMSGLSKLRSTSGIRATSVIDCSAAAFGSGEPVRDSVLLINDCLKNYCSAYTFAYLL